MRYQEAFGEVPPPDIWSPAKCPAKAAAPLKKGSLLAAALSALPMAGCTMLAANRGSGIEAGWMAVLFIGLALFTYLLVRIFPPDSSGRRDDGGCSTGASCGTGGGGGCCAGGGGGGCGGGCGG